MTDSADLRAIPVSGYRSCQQCDDGWTCEAHPGVAWPHSADDGRAGGCPGPGMPCVNGCLFPDGETQPRHSGRTKYTGPLSLGGELAEIEAYELGPDSSVMIVGGFHGTTAAIIEDLYHPRIMRIFEPQVAQAERLAQRFPGATVYPYGLGARSGSFPMREMGNDACSFFGSWNAPGAPETRDGGMGEMRDVAELFDFLEAPEIDLLHMNCEGGEFEILPRLIQTEAIRDVRYVLAQFHLVADVDSRYDPIVAAMERTHRVRWSAGPTWISWERR